MLRCDFVRRNHSQLNYNDNSVKRDTGKCASVYFMTVSNRNFQSGQTVQNLHNPCTQYCVQMWHLWNVIEQTYCILQDWDPTSEVHIRGKPREMIAGKRNYLILMSCWYMWATTHLCALFYVSARLISGKTKTDWLSFKWLIGYVWTVIVCRRHVCVLMFWRCFWKKKSFSHCVDGLGGRPFYPQMPPSLLTIDHSNAGLVVLFWLKPVLLVSCRSLKRSLLFLLVVFFCQRCFWKSDIWGRSGTFYS